MTDEYHYFTHLTTTYMYSKHGCHNLILKAPNYYKNA